MNISIAGIDWSLRGPGITVYEGMTADFDWSDCRSYFLTATKGIACDFPPNIFGGMVGPETDITRNIKLVAWAMECLPDGVTDVMIEAYAYGTPGRLATMAECVGLLKARLYERGVTVHTMAATSLKKFATGYGRAEKDDMHDAFLKETGVDLWQSMIPKRKVFGSPAADVVDSYYLLKKLSQEL